MAGTTPRGLHRPVGADPEEPTITGGETESDRLTKPNHVGLLADTLDPLVPQPGFLQPYAGGTAPEGWLLCDGSSLLRADYYDLFQVIGTIYGTVDADHFNIPDMRGRTGVGPDGAAGRLTANDTLGASGGAEKHTLSVTELPAHTHNVKSVGSHDGGANVRNTGGTNSGAAYDVVPTESTGGGGAHNNMQPYLVINWLIKT